MRLTVVALVGLLMLGLVGCQGACNPANPANSANPANPSQAPSQILYDSCGRPMAVTAAAAPCIPEPIYSGPQCPQPVYDMDATLNTWMGCNPPKMQAAPCPVPMMAAPCPMPQGVAPYSPMAQPPCAPQAMGAGSMSPCGEYPGEAAPGEVWCCVFVQPAAAAPQRVCVKPASQREIPVPAVYETRTKQVMVCPEQCRQIPVAPVFATKSEQVMVAAARTEWRQVACTADQLAAGEQQGNCWQLVEIPAVYETRCSQVCTQQASFRTETIPAKYATVSEQVCTKPACVRYEAVAAEYQMAQSAPPPGYWQWQRKPACEAGPAALGSPDGTLSFPPAGE